MATADLAGRASGVHISALPSRRIDPHRLPYDRARYQPDATRDRPPVAGPT
ncbi:MAG: hypothetical protein ABW039_01495 [Sphingobium sp.]